MIIKKKYFHISGTKTMKEAEAIITTDNYVSASLMYVTGEGYYWDIHRMGRYMSNGIILCTEQFPSKSTSLHECIVKCARKGVKKEKGAIEFFDSNIFSVVKDRLGYDIEYEVEK